MEDQLVAMNLQAGGRGPCDPLPFPGLSAPAASWLDESSVGAVFTLTARAMLMKPDGDSLDTMSPSPHTEAPGTSSDSVLGRSDVLANVRYRIDDIFGRAAILSAAT